MQNSITGGIFKAPAIQAETAHVTLGVRPPTIAGLPPLASAFTGRDRELGELETLLTSDGPLVVTVTGLGGIGKTTLAVAAGHALLEAGRFALALFVDLRGYDETPMEVGQTLDTLLRALGVPAEHIPPDPNARATLYRDQLEKHGEGVLVIADNASAAEQVRLLQPPSGRHRLLVTSRETLPSLGSRLHRVGVLSPESAVAVLDTAVRTARADDDRIAGDRDGARRIAALCSHLPLALRLAAAQFVLDQHLRPVELAEDLEDHAARLDLLHDGETGIRLVLDRSHRRLTAPQAELFRLLALSPGPDISTEAAAALTDRKPREVRSHLAGLAGTALIEQASEGGRWYLHDLVRAYALERVEQHKRKSAAARRRVLDYYTVTANAADDHVQALPGEDVSSLFRDRAQALEWFDSERVNLVAAVQTAAATGNPDIAMSLAPALCWYLERSFRPDEALVVMGAALEAALADDEDSVNAATAWNNFGLALGEVLRLDEAVEAFHRVSSICSDLGNRSGEGGAQDNLGNALRGLRRFDEAIAAHRRALGINRELGDRRDEAGTLNNLGVTFLEIRRFEEANQVLELALAIYRDLGHRAGEAVVWTNLADVLRELRRFDEAIEAHEQAVALFRQLGDRLGEARSTNSLGVTLTEVRRFDEAIEILQEARVIFAGLGNRYDEAVSLGNLGIALRSARRFADALEVQKAALAIQQELGVRDSEAIAWSNYGATLEVLNRSAEAEQACRQALKAFQELGDRHGEGRAWLNLGNSLSGLSRPDDAADAYQQALSISQELGDRYGEGQAWINLGGALRSTGNPEKAIHAHRKALEIDRHLGDRHGEADTWNELGLDLKALDRHEEALEAFGRSRLLYDACGDDYQHAATGINLGAVLIRLGRFEEAVDLHRDVLAIIRPLGSHRDLALAWYGLGEALEGIGATEEAEAAHDEAWRAFQAMETPETGESVA
ncbi:tetratricopeptide repeat protein [Streptomyces sp. FH025]|uniref:tetratricopeptide repeat protein n=1 Tax=Streptomyces sp. FH025 TaxID=2815937 RepID=UPI001A9EE0E7|nr:tetratricopeptide repeat protein [Streptomyces sp. FH025]MBO1416284.1 tetratricopeptide repeat protein [Streptomyces sp. FH025]